MFKDKKFWLQPLWMAALTVPWGIGGFIAHTGFSLSAGLGAYWLLGLVLPFFFFVIQNKGYGAEVGPARGIIHLPVWISLVIVQVVVFWNYLTKADIAWKINDDQRLGFKVGKGYNPGGAGVTFGVPYTSYEYDAEYVWNYELYHRWTSADKRLRINSNLFYNDYKDMQLPFTLGPNSIVIRNADKVVTYGAEINTEWQATEKLALNAGIGMLKTDIKRYPNSSIEGNKLARAPSFSGKVGANYRLLDHLEIGTNYSYNSSYYSTADNLANGKVGHYDQLDVYLAYDFKHARITLYADNVLNSRKDILLVPRSGDITRQPERQIGLSTELRF